MRCFHSCTACENPGSLCWYLHEALASLSTRHALDLDGSKLIRESCPLAQVGQPQAGVVAIKLVLEELIVEHGDRYVSHAFACAITGAVKRPEDSNPDYQRCMPVKLR